MIVYDRAAPLVFIHIPKTAGQSVQRVFQGWFGSGLVRHYFNEQTGGLPVLPDIDALHTPEAPVCVFGHFNRLRGFGVEHSCPGARQFVTILRDPFEMAVSGYYYTRRIGRKWTDQSRVPKVTLKSHLEQARPNMLNHFPRVVTAENYRDLVEEHFVEIGIMEHLPLSMRRLAAILGQPFPAEDMPHRNASARDDQVAEPGALRDMFCERNPLEFEVYAHARARFEQACAADPRYRDELRMSGDSVSRLT